MGASEFRMSRIQSRSNSPRLDLVVNDDVTESLLLQPEWDKDARRPTSNHRRFVYYCIGAVFLVIMFSGIMYKTRTHSGTLSASKLEELDRLSAVIGPPTAKFRDNLRPELKYITSWLDAGWTNDVITFMNLLYLAIITERIPIIGSFTPSHIGFEVLPIDFGTVFDVPRLANLIKTPVLEWHEVKDRNSTEVDELGCWDVWSPSQFDGTGPRSSRLREILNIDASHTRAPAWVALIPNYEHDRHASLSALSALAYPEVRAEALIDPVITESLHHHVRLPPDEHLLCYDYLYYLSSLFPVEFEYDYSPAWRFVGQHMHWTPEMEKLADQYVRRAMSIDNSAEPTPLYISIHVRHNDFATYCNDLPKDQCYATLDVIERRVEEVRQELLQRKGITVQHVIMTSDDRNATWWDDVKKKGWLDIDHSRTVQTYGHWYPLLVDAIIQSNGAGFVGTDGSTMSTMARRRVQSWHDGAVRTVKWGALDADNHRRFLDNL